MNNDNLKSISTKPCCSKIEAPWIKSYIETKIGEIPVVSTNMSSADKWGTAKTRLGWGRMNYKVTPGIYAVGSPDADSPVFVSANYKMSFDCLRKNLDNLNGWIMVIDTMGINVWCAAGKGTFGTDEIVNRIFLTRLTEFVNHRKLIVPQLGAPGIAAHQVKKSSGFKIIYGPIRAEDIKPFMANKQKATPEMRSVKFGVRDRLVLIPNDYIYNFKYAILAAFFIFLVSGLGDNIYSIGNLLNDGPINALLILLAYSIGMIIPPLLLPYLPGRAFALKGFWVGLAAAVFVVLYLFDFTVEFDISVAIAWTLIIVPIVSFIAMNFTGNSTYTSLSGVRKEMKYAVPFQIGGALIGLILLVTGQFL